MSVNELIGIILDRNNSDNTRTQALVSLQAKSERDKEVDKLIELFTKEKDNRQKSWIISILAGIHTKESLDFVYDVVIPDKENVWVRFWAITELAKTGAPRIQTLEELDNDNHPIVKNLVRRVLIGENIKKDYIEQMKKELGAGKSLNNRNVLRGLQFDTGIPIPKEIEDELFEPIKTILNNREALMDNRNLAAKVLGNFTHKREEAIKVLCDAYRVRVNAYVRRSMIDSVINLNDECTIDTLLKALTDRDAEIRERATKGLVHVAGGDGAKAIKIIVEQLMSSGTFDQDLINAIRFISLTQAAEVIKSHIEEHDDPDTKDRCLELLAYIGGEEAFSTIQALKKTAVHDYTKILNTTDQEVSGHFNSLMGRAHEAFSLQMMMHKVIFVLGILVLLLGLYTSLSEGSIGIRLYMGLFATGGGGLTVIRLFYRGPLKDIKKNMEDLLEITVLFLGYVRQLNQIDASFKQVFLRDDFTLLLMKETVTQLQDTVTKTMDAIKAAR